MISILFLYVYTIITTELNEFEPLQDAIPKETSINAQTTATEKIQNSDICTENPSKNQDELLDIYNACRKGEYIFVTCQLDLLYTVSKRIKYLTWDIEPNFDENEVKKYVSINMANLNKQIELFLNAYCAMSYVITRSTSLEEFRESTLREEFNDGYLKRLQDVYFLQTTELKTIKDIKDFRKMLGYCEKIVNKAYRDLIAEKDDSINLKMVFVKNAIVSAHERYKLKQMNEMQSLKSQDKQTPSSPIQIVIE